MVLLVILFWSNQKNTFNWEVIGWVISPYKGEENDMNKCVLKLKGNVVSQHTLNPLHIYEWQIEE